MPEFVLYQPDGGRFMKYTGKLTDDKVLAFLSGIVAQMAAKVPAPDAVPTAVAAPAAQVVPTSQPATVTPTSTGISPPIEKTPEKPPLWGDFCHGIPYNLVSPEAWMEEKAAQRAAVKGAVPYPGRLELEHLRPAVVSQVKSDKVGKSPYEWVEKMKQVDVSACTGLGADGTDSTTVAPQYTINPMSYVHEYDSCYGRPYNTTSESQWIAEQDSYRSMYKQMGEMAQERVEKQTAASIEAERRYMDELKALQLVSTPSTTPLVVETAEPVAADPIVVVAAVAVSEDTSDSFVHL